MTLAHLSIQRVTNRQPIAYDNAQRYHALRNVQPVVVGNGYFQFRAMRGDPPPWDEVPTSYENRRGV